MSYKPTRSTPIISSPLEEWTLFLDSLESELRDPLTNSITGNLVVLTCGCTISYKSNSDDATTNSIAQCPKCEKSNVGVLTRIDPLAKIYQKIQDQRTKLGSKLLSGDLGSLNASSYARSSSIDTSSSASVSANSIDDGLSNIDFDMIHPGGLYNKGELGEKPSLIDLFKSAATIAVPRNSNVQDWMQSISNTRSNTSSTTSGAPISASIRSRSSASSSTSSISASASASVPTHKKQSLPSSVEPNTSTSSNTTTQSNSPVLTPTASSHQGIMAPPPPNKLLAHTVNQLSGQMGLHLPLLPSHLVPDAEKREHNYGKCFPIYRKQFQHCTQSRSALWRSKKTAFSSCISPDASRFAIANNNKFQVYAIAPDFNDPPLLLCEPPVEPWGEFPMLSMSNSFVAIAGRNGMIRIYDFEARVLFERNLKMEIHSMALSPNDSMLAFGIFGKNPLTSDDSTPMIALHLLTPQYSHTSKSYTFQTEKQQAISIVVPYRDTIHFIKFSPDEAFLTCATIAESRFMVISLANYREPRLGMKSSRRVDPDEEYEGITSVNFFPSSFGTNNRHMVVTSSAANTSAPPIILDTKLSTPSVSSSRGGGITGGTGASSSVLSSSAPPALLMRVDKVGSRIHNSAVSSRADSVAFLDKSGVVYVMHAPGLLPDQRIIAVATEVAAASHPSLAASMQFSISGQVLIIVDRKGDVHIQDYGAGAPQQAGIGKCRLLS